ncbi:MAG: CPBP family intramembrane metalloprotease [Lachnospiraceae bacterium]|nr:CPBP family intramembrane metalloprotease [Lachnospiraceae bacterium]
MEIEKVREKNSYKEIGKQLGLFLGICLPITWILMGIGYKSVEGEQTTLGAELLITFACFMPAIAAIITSLINKEKLKNLMFMPKFKGHGKVYLMTFVLGIVISCTAQLLLPIFFPEQAKFNDEASVVAIVVATLIMLVVCCLQFWVGMGEELGWMGYLFPRLETLCGTTVALILTGIIRAGWHMVMLVQNENYLTGFLSLSVSNIMMGSVLVWATKAGKSVLPASLIHVMTNALPGGIAAFMILDDSVYSNDFSVVGIFTMLPGIIAGVICYIVLLKKYRVGK